MRDCKGTTARWGHGSPAYCARRRSYPYARSVSEPDFLLFASDAELAIYWAGAFLLAALLCMLMERRRLKRAEINRVGWVPWTGLFLVFAVIGGGLLAVAIPAIMRG